MRLWTLHPRYLDARGLVALWREALLAQAVLAGQTRGYTRHPQLRRFLDTPAPLATIATYLHAVQSEAALRGYRFDATRIVADPGAHPVEASRGQLDYEWQHLVAKLRNRDPAWLERFVTLSAPEAHPLFRIVPGPVADWEVMQPDTAIDQTQRDKSAPGR